MNNNSFSRQEIKVKIYVALDKMSEYKETHTMGSTRTIVGNLLGVSIQSGSDLDTVFREEYKEAARDYSSVTRARSTFQSKDTNVFSRLKAAGSSETLREMLKRGLGL